MFAPEFDYYKATSVSEAIQLLNAHRDAKVLAGGHSLLPLLKLRLARPAALVDIGGIADLRGISIRNDVVQIGALTTHWAIASSAELQRACPLLAEVAAAIGDPQVRNRGTIGGNVVHADPASDWPTGLTALNARFTIQGPGGLGRRGARTVSPADFFAGALTTHLAPNEILTAIQAPVLRPNQRSAYAKVAHPASSYAVVGAAVVLTVEGDRCTAASIAVGGLVPAPVRATSVENALAGQPLTLDRIAAAAGRVGDDLGTDILGDIYASAEYRRAMAQVEVRHALVHAAGLVHH
jgi:carbon-monoxide dehydrogenase medium subunit